MVEDERGGEGGEESGVVQDERGGEDGEKSGVVEDEKTWGGW